MTKDKEIKRKENQKIVSRKIEKPLLNFDVYFSLLMKENKKIFLHHKAPMRNYAKQKGLINATKEDFDKIFIHY